jgi:Bacterial Ig-like domain (group 2)
MKTNNIKLHGLLLTFLIGSTFGAMAQCEPNYGPRQVAPGQAPSISMSGLPSTLADTCSSASVSVAAPTVTPINGEWIQYDQNDCADPQTGTLSLQDVTTSWTASGCGASPSSGSLPCAFSVSSPGVCTVTFTATGTTDDPSGTYSSSCSATFNAVAIQFLDPSGNSVSSVPVLQGGGANVGVSVVPSSATVTFTSSDSSVATVSGSAPTITVNGIAVGTTAITGTLNGGATACETLGVTVSTGSLTLSFNP